jgi:hypothetical protein
MQVLINRLAVMFINNDNQLFYFNTSFVDDCIRKKSHERKVLLYFKMDIKRCTK